MGSIPGLGRSPGGGNGNPLQYSCLEKTPMNREAWQATVHGVTKSLTQVSDLAHTHTQVALQSCVSFCCYEVNKLYLYIYLLLLGLLFPTPIPIPRIQVTAKKTYRWPTGAWKDAHYNKLSEKCRSKRQWGITSHWSEWSSAKMSANSKCWRGLVERVEGKRGPLYSWWECI